MARLTRLFEQQLADLGELETLLALETTALAEAQNEKIVQLAGEKEGIIGRLAANAQELELLLREEGFTPTLEGLTAFIRHTEPSGELAALHRKVTHLLRTCRSHNQTNAVVLQRRRIAVERALRILFQHQATPERYSASGKLDGVGGYRSIGEA
jgi:flagellar biosynthesis/type III secretory pathway chaperone